MNARADAAFSYTVAADTITDPDSGDTVTYSLTLADGSPLPAWLTFDASTGLLSGTPAAADVGTLQLELRGTDSHGLFASEVVNLVVAPPNHAPVVAAELPDQSAAQGMAFNYVVAPDAFADADGDALSFEATLADGSALPGWLAFDGVSRTFSGTPTQPGSVSVRVTATDGSLSASDAFDITIGAQGLALVGTPRADILRGGSSNDTLSGLGGSDILIGAGGNDTLDGGGGIDIMYGGAGDDTYIVNNSADQAVELATQGIDTVLSSVTFALAANIENLTLTALPRLTAPATPSPTRSPATAPTTC